MNRLYRDYAKHLIEAQGMDQPFLTDSFIDISLRHVVFAFALIDLPLQSQNAPKHRYQSDRRRGINITAGGNAVLFKKDTSHWKTIPTKMKRNISSQTIHTDVK
jgi:hypothetical protein